VEISEAAVGDDIQHRPETWKINTLTGIFVISSIAAAFVVYFILDSLKRYPTSHSFPISLIVVSYRDLEFRKIALFYDSGTARMSGSW
jgi:hypothetical protein